MNEVGCLLGISELFLVKNILLVEAIGSFSRFSSLVAKDIFGFTRDCVSTDLSSLTGVALIGVTLMGVSSIIVDSSSDSLSAGGKRR